MEKPILIQELESELNTTFKEVDLQEIIQGNKNKCAEYTIYKHQVIGLHIEKFELSRLPEKISKFKYLEYLNLYNNNLSDISAITGLIKLKRLYLKGNKLSKLPLIKNLQTLEKLNLSNNQLVDISALQDLENLTELNLSFNQLSDISALKHLQKLVALDISSNQIDDHNTNSLRNITGLKRLDISFNQITEITDIQHLTQLNRLFLRDNPIQKLPEWICDFSNMDIQWEKYNMNNNYMTLYNLPLKEPPIEIVKQGKESIKDYFEQKKVAEIELKLILTGNSRAGKTTLLEFMKDPKVFTDKESTHGIMVEKIKWKNFNLNVWDFGGQDYYHATHRLFLTNNAVYILVWEQNSNKTEKKETPILVGEELQNVFLQNYDYEHWLTVIRKYDDLGRKNSIDEEQKKHHSPVVMLQNKIDDVENGNNEIGVLDKVEKQRYKIDGDDIFAISIKETHKNWDNTERYVQKYVNEYRKFEERLQELIKQELQGHQVLEYDMAIRTAVRERKENIISFSDYKRMCSEATKTILEKPITEDQIRFATERLHNQGILIYYGYISDSQLLKENVFIKPQYVTDTIYRILNKKVKENEGKFSFSDVAKIFIDKGFSEEEAKYDVELFIDLMQSPNFELIFKYDTNVYYATQYLREELDENKLLLFEQQSETYDLAFVLRYDGFFSQSIISRIIARYGFGAKQYKGKDIFWKYGLPFIFKGESFWIYCQFEENKIYLKAQKGKKSQNIADIYTEILRISENDENIKISFDDLSYKEIKYIKTKNFLPMEKTGNISVEIGGDSNAPIIINSSNTNITQQISNLEEDFISKLTDEFKSEFADIKNIIYNGSRSNSGKVLKELVNLIKDNKDKLDEKHLAFFEQVQNDKGLQTKAKISAVIPLLPLFGINIGFEAEQSLNSGIKKFGTRLIRFLEKSSTLYPKYYYGRM